MAAPSELELLSQTPVHGGLLYKFSHYSNICHCSMHFNVWIPPNTVAGALYYLSGLTCNEDNASQKGTEMFRAAARHNLMVVLPDTSPRGPQVEACPNVTESWSFGIGAGFYVDATQPAYSEHFRMASYVTYELTEIVEKRFPCFGRRAVLGHSMGGHGALVLALKHPEVFASVSAFAPIAHPSVVPWGINAFSKFFGDDRTKWAENDATELVRRYTGPKRHILIDQGLSDEFLEAQQLRPQDLAQAAKDNEHVEIALRYHNGHGHSYYFVSTFIADHVEHHAKALAVATATS